PRCALRMPGRLVRLQFNQLVFVRQVRLRCFRLRYVLRNEVFLRARLAVIVRPAVYRGYFDWPVSVLRESRRGPFESVRLPRVCRRQLTTENTVDEIEQEDELRTQCNNRRNTYELLQIGKTAKCVEVREGVIPSREPSNTNVEHREEDKVYTYKCKPEVDVAESPVHHAPEHLREPVIDTRQHAEE